MDKLANFNKEFDKLNFHDSYIENINFSDEGLLRIRIHYYNWEGNKNDAEQWVTKNLTIEIEHCLHFKFSSPGLSLDDQEIYDHECFDLHMKLAEQIDNFKKNRKSVYSNTIAVKFLTHSYGEPVFNESTGFFEIGGLNARLIWSDNNEIVAPIHIPAGDKNN
jgi:hypothetical protein